MKNPYVGKPFYTKWRKAIAGKKIDQIDPVVSLKHTINKSELIATAGSCFAQHISKFLSVSGFNFYQTEKPHQFISAESDEYGYLYSARYGNIYTSRQLLQLVQRAMGIFNPPSETWSYRGNYVDPFRPTIQPNGFISQQELLHDQSIHLQAVAEMVKNMDVFVYTLGLTECWVNKSTNVVYSLCPGVAGGLFDSNNHKIINLSVEDIVNDFSDLIDIIRLYNPKVRYILTVSPVALSATALDQHILLSNTYSKSVLRVAAQSLTDKFNEVSYFPSYEIILGQHNRGKYLSEDCREITTEGVERVMHLFEQHIMDTRSKSDYIKQISEQQEKDFNSEIIKMFKAQCDEERYS